MSAFAIINSVILTDKGIPQDSRSGKQPNTKTGYLGNQVNDQMADPGGKSGE
jgi:hypothetical protein